LRGPLSQRRESSGDVSVDSRKAAGRVERLEILGSLDRGGIPFQEAVGVR
jgi:hypothetical protein